MSLFYFNLLYRIYLYICIENQTNFIMNYPLARELYGQPWCMDSHSLPGLLGTLAMIRSGVNLEIPTIKYNTPELLTTVNDTRVITRPFGNEWEPGQLDNNESFSGIGVININGPITLNGGASSIGMAQLSDMMYMMAADDRMVGFIIKGNSGGGASAAVEVMEDTILDLKQRIPVHGFVPKGGMAASAMYMILSACTGIWSASGMNVFGSNGTMIQFDGQAANTTDSEGNKHVRIYATKSTMKNKAFEEALNNDNYELLTSELLDPVNENALSRVVANRPMLEGSDYDNGHTVFAKNAIGTFVDGIASFEQVIKMVEAESSIQLSTNRVNNNNSNSTKMTREELKSQHPELFSSVVAEGVASEKDRAGAWMVFAKADPDAVSKGVASGLPLSQTDMASLMVKMNSASFVESMKADSAAPVVVPESAAGQGAEPNSAIVNKELEAAFAFEPKKL